jgi:hypothetical protein
MAGGVEPHACMVVFVCLFFLSFFNFKNKRKFIPVSNYTAINRSVPSRAELAGDQRTKLAEQNSFFSFNALRRMLLVFQKQIENI